jgi:hypothetical protein
MARRAGLCAKAWMPYPRAPPPTPPNRKLDEQPVDEDLRATIRAFCVGLSDACNKYYAFGSVFSEEV